MEDWEIELMQTPNTISSYMMGEYQRMNIEENIGLPIK